MVGGQSLSPTAGPSFPRLQLDPAHPGLSWPLHTQSWPLAKGVSCLGDLCQASDPPSPLLSPRNSGSRVLNKHTRPRFSAVNQQATFDMWDKDKCKQARVLRVP